MRAALAREFGPPESLRVEEVEAPTPARDQVVVEVEACAVNFTDYLVLQDRYQVKPKLPFIPGTEVAGRICQTGDGVEDLFPGDRVFAWVRTGGLAERVAVARNEVFRIPADIDSVSASAFFYGYGTAHYALKHCARLQRGEHLVVLGAAGGVGLAAVELGAAMGAVVIACASTQEKLETCEARGATLLVNYEREDLKERLRELTGGKGADVVYDAVGGSYSEPALRATAWGGRYLVIGFATGEIPSIPLNLPLLKGCSIVGVFWGAFIAREPEQHEADIDEIRGWWAKGMISPYVSATYPLERAGEAIRHLAERAAIGKVVVKIK